MTDIEEVQLKLRGIKNVSEYYKLMADKKIEGEKDTERQKHIDEMISPERWEQRNKDVKSIIQANYDLIKSLAKNCPHADKLLDSVSLFHTAAFLLKFTDKPKSYLREQYGDIIPKAAYLLADVYNQCGFSPTIEIDKELNFYKLPDVTEIYTRDECFQRDEQVDDRIYRSSQFDERFRRAKQIDDALFILKTAIEHRIISPALAGTKNIDGNSKSLLPEIVPSTPGQNAKVLREYIKGSNKKIDVSLGKLTIKKQIGQGGNSIVYRAALNNQDVAVKFLVADFEGETGKRKYKRFLAEYNNIVQLPDQKNIVRYIGYDVLTVPHHGTEIKIPFIIMKLYEGSLKEMQKTPNESDLQRLFNFLLETVEKIHSNGIIHRDIKPENILIDGDDFVLADFGIASYNPEAFHLMAQTGKSERVGNRFFSAPEQVKSGAKPHATMDMYAIGQVLQWYATGDTHTGEGRKLITTIFPTLELQDLIIEKCLQNDPKKRFQDISEIRDFVKQSKQNVNKVTQTTCEVLQGEIAIGDITHRNCSNLQKEKGYLQNPANTLIIPPRGVEPLLPG